MQAQQTQAEPTPAPEPTDGHSGPPDAPPAMEEQLLRDLGPNLPIGVDTNGVRATRFRLRPFRMKEEKELASLKEAKGGKAMTFGELVSEILARLVQTVGPHSFDDKTHGERRLLIGQLYMADVLYMYLYLRYEALGVDTPISMATVCPNCRHQGTFEADLGTLKVRVVQGDKLDLRRRYELRDTIKLRNTDVKTLVLEPLKWHWLESREYAMGNQGDKEALTIIRSVVGAEGLSLNPFVLMLTEMDELTKYDISGLTSNIEEFSPGPIMGVEPDCPQCKLGYMQMIDWRYDSFFTRSSQRKGGRIS